MSEQEKKGLVPALRFPEFRNGGEWEVKQLKHACDMQAGKFVQASEIQERSNDNLYPCYGGNGLRGYTKTYTHEGTYSLIGRQGALCGNVNLVSGRFHATEHAVVTTPKAGADTNWLFYKLVLLNLNQFATGQAQPGLSVENLEKVGINLPRDIDEQQKIANCLTSIDELITAQTQKLDALKTHKKGLMQQLFPAEGETVPKLRFPEFRGKGEWELKELGQLATYTKGFAFKSQDYRSEGIRIIRVSDLGAEFIKPDSEKVFIASELAGDYERYKLNKGEIIITTVGSKPELVDSAVGRGVFVHHSNEGFLNQNLLKLEVVAEVNSRFLFSNINTTEYQEFIASISRGNANQANIAVKELMKFELKVPGPNEQQRIANCLISVDELITAQTQKLEALKVHKKGLMQQLFPAVDDDGIDT